MGNTVNLNQLTALSRFSSEFSNLSDDYLFTRLTSDTILRAMRFDSLNGIDHIDGPLRIDGISWILCVSGQLDFELNLTPVTLTSECITVIPPGSMIEMKKIDPTDLDCYLLFVSTEFMHDINFDLNVIGSSRPLNFGQRSDADRVMHITPDETAGLREYFSLLHRNSSENSDNLYTKSIARCLIAALLYQVLNLVTRRLKDSPDEVRPSRSRRSTYVNEFMRLVHEHHVRERSVAFYAGKLFISPKYLSLIIKESTGRSATEVIDSYVILEAKNLLRFSGKNIQQVAYELNFPNQSSFGKYFKHLTGMSPSEYQRS
ncbi:MAG: AraC family transcriptional regulator [Duncaniella sp.]|nr:helix-turn-helix transcriptional regulator [Bacteroides sp.]MDE6065673.1 AraC family transcriptional regulator [Duncaniella sp.]